ncbi:hypothetical protein A7864_19920, partial [Salmonella enterica]|nr:hypothetical protein [Salmonella enterica]
LFFIEKRRKVSVWLGCEQRGAIFGNYWLLIVFPKVVCYKKRAPKGSFVIVNLLVRRLMHADRAA